MAMNRILFQPGMSVPQFMELYGAEQNSEADLEAARWPRRDSTALGVDRKSMAWSMGAATSGISVESVVIRYHSLLESSQKRRCCLSRSGS